MALAKKQGEKEFRIRLPGPLHDELSKAKAARGIASLNKEIVHRLEQSFQIDRVIGGAIVDDKRLLAILKIIGMAMNNGGRYSAFAATMDPKSTDTWLSNPFAYEHGVKAVNFVLEEFRPKGDATSPKLAIPTASPDIGVSWAHAILEDVARGAARTSNDIGKIQLIVDDLGDELLDRIKHLAVGGSSSASEAWGPKKSAKRSKK